MLQKTHKKILEAALQIVKNAEIKQQKNYLKEGVISPDKYFKVVNHFYSPKEKRGIRPFGNARARGVNCFNKALKTYNKDKKKAYFLLGNSLHYLADLAVPAHSKLVVHIFESDDLEMYLERNIDKIKIMKKRIHKNRIEDYFTGIAKESSKLATERNSAIISLRFKITKKKDILPEKELKAQSKKIACLAVSYSAGLIKSFIRLKSCYCPPKT